jgi:hypothetical protein
MSAVDPGAKTLDPDSRALKLCDMVVAKLALEVRGRLGAENPGGGNEVSRGKFC